MQEVNLFGTEEETKEEEQLRKTIYTTKLQIPQYIPSEVCPSLTECVDTTKYDELVEEINKSNVSPEEKYFLKLAATRHIKFTYSKIADYYAHGNKELQKLMERSALVIIDFNDAIANGYVQMSEKISNIMSWDSDGDSDGE